VEETETLVTTTETFLTTAEEMAEMSTFLEFHLLFRNQPEMPNVLFAHTNVKNVVEKIEESATETPVLANANLDGPGVPAPTAMARTLLLLMVPLQAHANAHSAHTRTPNVVELNVVPATNKPENANARPHGLEVPAPEETDNQPPTPTTVVVPLEEEPTSLQAETTNAQCAHTRTKNVVELNVEIATVKLVTANVKTDGPEVPALPGTENQEMPPTEARSSNAQCAHTKRPNVVELIVVPATNKPENAIAKETGEEEHAATKEKSSELVMPELPTQTRPPSTAHQPPHPHGLSSLEFWLLFAPFSLSSSLFWSSRSIRDAKKKFKEQHRYN